MVFVLVVVVLLLLLLSVLLLMMLLPLLLLLLLPLQTTELWQKVAVVLGLFLSPQGLLLPSPLLVQPVRWTQRVRCSVSYTHLTLPTNSRV